MALGGGKWEVQNKILPGSYINVVSKALATFTLSERGVSAIPVELDWGKDGEIFKVEIDDLLTNSTEIFGYDSSHEKLKYIREAFKHGKTIYFYRLNSGVKAKNTIAEAKHSGIRGSDISTVVSKDIDEPNSFIVETLLELEVVDRQIVKKLEDLKDNGFVKFTGTGVPTVSAGLKLTNGSNATEVKVSDYQTFLDKIDSLSFNALACPSNDDAIKVLFVEFTKRMRDESGAFFQTVLYDNENKFDHEGIITLANRCISDQEYAGVYWLTGAESSVAVNKSLSNDSYDGELEFYVDYKQSELEELLEEGRLVLHKVNGEIRVLLDINSFVSYDDSTGDKQKEFRDNQTVRVFDGIGLELALIFNNKYNGKEPNDKAGRESLWSDIVTINRLYEEMRAIEDFNADDLEVLKGKQDGGVVVKLPIKPVTSMTHLYATIMLV